MQRAINIRNTRTVNGLRIEKAAYLLLGVIAYAVGCLKDKLAPVFGVCDVDCKRQTRRSAKDRDTKIADFCAVAVALTVAAVIYVTLLFCVGEGHANGIGTELLISGFVYGTVYGIIRFFTSI